MLAAAVLFILMPVIILAIRRSRCRLLSIVSGALSGIAALLPLTILTGQISQHLVIYAPLSLAILAFSEECFRFAGLKIVFGQKSLARRVNLFDFILFGFGFGLLEFGLRTAAALMGDFQDCVIWELGYACSGDFQDFMVIAAHALVLHILLSAIYFPLAFKTTSYSALMLIAASVVHASANSFAIETVYHAESNSGYLYAIVLAIAVYVGSLAYAGLRHGSDDAWGR